MKRFEVKIPVEFEPWGAYDHLGLTMAVRYSADDSSMKSLIILANDEQLVMLKLMFADVEKKITEIF